MARKLGVEVAILREKGDRLTQKIEEEAAKRFLKKPKTEAKPDHIKKLEDTLLALKIYGGITKTQIALDVPEDETRLDELEMIFASEQEASGEADYEKIAAELWQRYETEVNKQKIFELNAKLAEMDDDDPEYEKVLMEIRDLQNPIK